MISKNVAAKLRKEVSVPVELTMRYQNPSIPYAIEQLAKQELTDLLLIPLFPHFAMSSFETAVERVKEVITQSAPGMKLTVQPPFYEDPDYIDAMVASAEPWLSKPYDHLLFSFHGIPEHHLRKSDPTGCHCLATPDCCEESQSGPRDLLPRSMFRDDERLCAIKPASRKKNTPIPSNPGLVAIPG